MANIKNCNLGFNFNCGLLILYTIGTIVASLPATASEQPATSDGNIFTPGERNSNHNDPRIKTPDAKPDRQPVRSVTCQNTDLKSQSQSAFSTPTLPEHFTAREIKVIDSTVFSLDQLNRIVKPFVGKDLTPAETQKIADAITQLYLNKGYINSRAIPVAGQNNTDNTLVIQVIEGRIAEIEIQGMQRLHPEYICSRVKLGTRAPLNTAQLENQLKLLRLDPLFSNVEASLRPTGKSGQTNLIVRVSEANPFITSFSVDNYSPPAVGSERLGVAVGDRNLTGIGDELTASYYRTTTGGSDSLDFSYTVPVNAMNGTVQLRAAPNRNKITESPYNKLRIRGSQELYEINYRQPLVRSPKQEFALSLGFAYQEGQTFLFDRLPRPFGSGPDEKGVSRTSVIKFSQDYTRRDPQGAWSLRSQFNFGTGLFNATSNPEPIPDGKFFSWVAQAQRAQRLSNDQLLLVQAELQLTPNSLLPSQSFVIGGGQSVRGYRQNARFGDNGFRLSVEDRIIALRNESGLPMIQVIPFIDLGSVWNKPDNPNKQLAQTFLGSAGLGLLWNEAMGIDHLSFRLDYGIPFINLKDRRNNVQDEGFYFSVRYQP